MEKISEIYHFPWPCKTTYAKCTYNNHVGTPQFNFVLAILIILNDTFLNPLKIDCMAFHLGPATVSPLNIYRDGFL